MITFLTPRGLCLAFAGLLIAASIAAPTARAQEPVVKETPAKEPAVKEPSIKETHTDKTKPRVREYPSKDGLVIRADLYAPNKDRSAPLIVLFHQAGWSRGEYVEIAPRLNALGFNCLAVDLRSGGEVNGVVNQTHDKAKRTKGMTEYYDAIPDVIASLEYARKRLTKGKVIAWGSSYSAALVLHVAGKHPKLADAVLSFAPGEYYKKQGPNWVEHSAKTVTVPTFITSAKDEHANWKAIFDAIPHKKKTAFLPETKGNHGSRALWKKFEDSPAYWAAATKFLNEHFPTKKAQKAAQETPQETPQDSSEKPKK